MGHTEVAGLASPSNLEGFICNLPVPAATRSGFMNDFKHLSGDSNRTKILLRLSFSVLLEDIHDKKDRRSLHRFYVKVGLLSGINQSSSQGEAEGQALISSLC